MNLADICTFKILFFLLQKRQPQAFQNLKVKTEGFYDE